MRRSVPAALALSLLASVAVAQAEPAQEFSFQLTDVKRDGRFTVSFTSRNYDTTGAVPPSPSRFHIRLPAGAKLRRQFLARRVLCDARKLNSTHDPRTCRRSQIGTGRVLVDARPFITELIPADLWLFLSRGRDRRSVASMAILGKPDRDAPIVRDTPIVRDYRAPVAFLDFFDEPTPDGRFGYRLAFPSNPTGGASFSIAETRVVARGFTLAARRKSCPRREAGRCARRKVRKRKLFWFTPPSCPSSGKLSFQAFFSYAAFGDITKTTEIACPRFR